MHHSVLIVYQQNRLILSSAQLFRYSGGRWSNGADSLSCFWFLFFFFFREGGLIIIIVGVSSLKYLIVPYFFVYFIISPLSLSM